MHVHKAAFNHVTTVYRKSSSRCTRKLVAWSGHRWLRTWIFSCINDSHFVFLSVWVFPVWAAPSCFLSLETPIIGYFSFRRRRSMYGVSCVELFEDSKCWDCYWRHDTVSLCVTVLCCRQSSIWGDRGRVVHCSRFIIIFIIIFIITVICSSCCYHLLITYKVLSRPRYVYSLQTVVIR